MDDGEVLFGDGFQHGGDKVGVRRQGDVFLGSGADCPDRRLGVIANSAGDDGKGDVFALQGLDEISDIQRYIDHCQVGAIAAPERGQAGFGRIHLFDLGAALNGDLAGGADLAFKGADYE